MRVCTKCKVEQVLSEFYKDRQRRDGIRSICKACTKVTQKIYNQTDRGKSLAKDRSKKPSYRESHNKATSKYLKTDKGKEFSKSNRELRRKEFPERVKAAGVVNYALKLGKLRRPRCCSRCPSEDSLEAHHWSYLEEHWLDIIWLCTLCHNEEHKRLDSDNRGG